MDTVTEAHLAIALAQEGGLGIIHKNMSIEAQAAEVDKVKRSESGMIVDPVTVAPDAQVAEALALMARFRISGVPVTVGPKLVGILTNRDLRFETRTHLPVSDLMTKEDLITVPVGTTLEQAKEILHKHKVEKLLVVDEDYNLKGLITVKDIQKQIKYPHACKDELGRLRVGAAVGVTEDVLDRVAALVEAKVDVVVVDTAHGHTKGVLDAVEQHQGRLRRPGADRRQRGHRRGGRGPDRRRGERGQGGHGARLDLHHAGGLRRRHAPDHRHLRGRPGRRGHRHPDHRRRRHQVLRRRHQGHRRRRRLGHDRLPLRRDRREPRAR